MSSVLYAPTGVAFGLTMGYSPPTSAWVQAAVNVAVSGALVNALLGYNYTAPTGLLVSAGGQGAYGMYLGRQAAPYQKQVQAAANNIQDAAANIFAAGQLTEAQKALTSLDGGPKM
jgi:hypothetical protein